MSVQQAQMYEQFTLTMAARRVSPHAGDGPKLFGKAGLPTHIIYFYDLSVEEMLALEGTYELDELDWVWDEDQDIVELFVSDARAQVIHANFEARRREQKIRRGVKPWTLSPVYRQPAEPTVTSMCRYTWENGVEQRIPWHL
jgi:hypothetical protein